MNADEIMKNNDEFIQCSEVHPLTGDACMLDMSHQFSSNALIKQHVAANGVKWPSLHELDPNEGWNEILPHKM